MHLFKHKGWTKDTLAAAIKKEYDIVAEIVDLAIAQGCQLRYPFQGQQIGPFAVPPPGAARKGGGQGPELGAGILDR